MILLIGSLCSISAAPISKPSHPSSTSSAAKSREVRYFRVHRNARIGCQLIDRLSFRSIACRQSPNADVQKIEVEALFRWIEEAEVVIRAVTRIQRKGGKDCQVGTRLVLLAMRS